MAGKSIRAYFIGKSVAFYGFFSYVGEYRIIKIPITWHVNPLYSASEAIRKILFYEYTLSQVFMEITFLLTIGSLIFLIGAVLFAKRVYRLD